MRKNKVVEILSKEVGTDHLQFISGEILNPGTDGCKLSENHGSVYGIAIKLKTQEEKEEIFNYRDKESMEIEDWLSIGDDYYPLYWGKTSYMGVRLQDHITEQAGKWSIQLNNHPELIDKALIYATIPCQNALKIEKQLQKNYPDIYKTKKGKSKKKK